MADQYRWTRWAAPGGTGQEIAGWAAIALGLVLAVLVFRVVPHWWWALPAALLAWFVGTTIAGWLWATLRFIIEKLEGIG